MRGVALRVLLNDALAGEFQEVVLSERAEEGQLLQELKLLLVGLSAQQLLHLQHCLLPLSLHYG